MKKKQSESGKSIFRNVVFGFSTWVIPVGLSFFATPILLNAMGDQDYGIYMLVLGFIAYSFNFGIGRAITKYIAEYRASGEHEKIKEVISATFFLNFAIAAFGIILIAFLARWLVVDVFAIAEDSQSKSVNAFYAAAGIVFLAMLIQVFSAVLQGIHRFDIYSKIYNLNIFFLISGNIILAKMGYGLLSLLCWNLAVSALTGVVYGFAARKLLPEFKLTFRFSRESLILVSKFSFGIVGYQILANLLLLFERGWITRMLGAESLTYYVVPMMLSLYIHSFISSSLLVIFPLASELKDDKEKLLRIYKKATKIVCLLVVFMAMSLIVQSGEFLTLWIGPLFSERSATLLIIHTLTFSVIAIQIVSWQMTEGLGFPNYNFKLFSVCLILAVSGILLSTNEYGSLGIAISRLIGFSTIFLSVFYVEKWFFDQIQILFWLKIIGVLTVAGLAGAVVELLIIKNFEISWFILFASTISAGIVYCFVVWILGFITNDEKTLIKNIVRS